MNNYNKVFTQSSSPKPLTSSRKDLAIEQLPQEIFASCSSTWEHHVPGDRWKAPAALIANGWNMNIPFNENIKWRNPIGKLLHYSLNIPLLEKARLVYTFLGAWLKMCFPTDGYFVKMLAGSYGCQAARQTAYQWCAIFNQKRQHIMGKPCCYFGVVKYRWKPNLIFLQTS